MDLAGDAGDIDAGDTAGGGIHDTVMISSNLPSLVLQIIFEVLFYFLNSFRYFFMLEGNKQPKGRAGGVGWGGGAGGRRSNTTKLTTILSTTRTYL